LLARARVDTIVDRDRDLFAAFAGAVRAGLRMTILLGNHDVELALPSVRARFLESLDPDDTGRVRMIFDGEAYVVGDALIEHGNRYDGFNVIDHDALRRMRSAQSRRISDARAMFEPPPGSRLVVEVMNQLKREYPFIDLLKPETSAVLPILLTLEPACRRHVLKVANLYLAASRRASDGARPNYEGDIAATTGGELLEVLAEHMPHETARDFAASLAVPVEQDIASRSSVLGMVRLALARDRDGLARRLPHLLQALRALEQDRTFELETESPEYLDPAREIAAGGFRYVVFGHTHLAKRVDLGGGRTYFNTGTWADLIRFPSEIFATPDSQQLEALNAFITDLVEKKFERWLLFRPTYVRLDVDGDAVQRAELAVYE
jgi:UDP-2,3-diacylglucosamine pyrophosphatase LpxH